MVSKLPKEFLTFSRRYDRLIRVKIISTLIFSFYITSAALATTTLTGVSGASVATASNVESDTSWTVYGGIQTGKTVTDFPSCSNGGACNTCVGNNDGGTPPIYFPCNESGVFATTILTFTGTTTVANTGGNKWLLCDGVTDRYSSTDLNTSLTVPWGTLCADNGGNGTCTGGFSKTMTFGAATDCNTLNGSSEKVSVKFYSRDVDISVAGADSTYDPANCSALTGACLFGLYPGDGKVYLEKDVLSVDTSTGVTNVPYTGIVFFSTEESAADGGDDRVTFNRVATGPNAKIDTFTISSDGTGLEGTYIGSLNNDIKYCFKMGSKDAAGNIDHISSTDCQVAGGNTNDCTTTAPAICMTPSEVVGILTDKKCFIATAAYGSDMDQHVQMLRQFRNEFMAPFWIGRKLVKAYYSASPVLAHWIARHEEARTLTRWMLWPVMGWAELALNFGWSVVIAPFLIMVLGLMIFRRRKQGIKKA